MSKPRLETLSLQDGSQRTSLNRLANRLTNVFRCGSATDDLHVILSGEFLERFFDNNERAENVVTLAVDPRSHSLVGVRNIFKLKPGRYLLREVVQDTEDHHIAALNRTVQVP